jgi:hypothetical protein
MKLSRQKELADRFPSMLVLMREESESAPRIQTPVGWNSLVEAMLEQLAQSSENEGSPALVIAQLKEKMAGLCVYFQEPGPDAFQQGIVALARALSYRTCDVCGAPGAVNKVTRHWLGVRCEAHRVAELPPGPARPSVFKLSQTP